MHDIRFIDYSKALKRADPKDTVLFCRLLTTGYKLLDLTDKIVAREFGISRTTVGRWRNGVNAPHFIMRKSVLAWLERRAQKSKAL